MEFNKLDVFESVIHSLVYLLYNVFRYTFTLNEIYTAPATGVIETSKKQIF